MPRKRPRERRGAAGEVAYAWQLGKLGPPGPRLRRILVEGAARLSVESFPHSNQYKKGTWKGLRLAAGKRSAGFTCPRCGLTGSLSDHEIRPDGTVNPSVVCPGEGCDFHAFIRLEGWKP